MWLRGCFLGRILTSDFFFLFVSSLLHVRLLCWHSLLSLIVILRIFVFCILILRLLRRGTSLFIQVSLSLCFPLIISLAILSLWELIFVAGLAHDAIALVHEPRVTDASLVVTTIIEGVSCREGHEVTRVGLDTLGEVLGVCGISLLWEWTHLRTTKMILRVQVEEVEQIEVDLSSVIGCIRLCSELHIALFIAIEDISGGAESREDLTELIVLVWFVVTSGNLVHGRHWATGSHVHPQC